MIGHLLLATRSPFASTRHRGARDISIDCLLRRVIRELRAYDKIFFDISVVGSLQRAGWIAFVSACQAGRPFARSPARSRRTPYHSRREQDSLLFCEWFDAIDEWFTALLSRDTPHWRQRNRGIRERKITNAPRRASEWCSACNGGISLEPRGIPAAERIQRTANARAFLLPFLPSVRESDRRSPLTIEFLRSREPVNRRDALVLPAKNTTDGKRVMAFRAST